MGAKRSKKLLPTVKTAIEFAIIISIFMALFTVINLLGGFDWIYRIPANQHEELHKYLIATAFLALALAVCSVKRLLGVRKAYRRLAKSEEQLRFQSALLNEIGDGITATNLKGIITYVNQAQCNRVKRSRDELIGQSVSIYGQSEDFDKTQRELFKTTLEKGEWSGEIVNTLLDSSKIIVECRTWLMKDKNGNPIGMAGVSRDITEKKLQEQELLKHKRYLEALDTAVGILLHSMTEVKYDDFLAALGPASDADRVHIFLKPADEPTIPLRRKAQWCRNERILPVQTELTEKRFLSNIFPQWQKILKTGQHLCFCTKSFPPQQIDFWESLHIKALLIVPVLIDGQLNGFMSFDNCTEARQWTESEIDFLSTVANDLAIAIRRIEIKKELKQQRDFAQRLVETAQTIVLVLDKDANIVTFNPYLEKLTGYQLDEVKGKNWFDTFLPEEDRQKIKDVFAKAITDISTKGNINSIIVRDGSLRYVEWFDKTLTDDNGQITGLLSTGQDITERKQAENSLKHYLSLLVSSLESTADGILIVDGHGKMTRWNKKFVEMWHIPEDILARKSDDDAIEYVLSQLKVPEQFVAKVRALYAQPDASSFDQLEFKDGRVFERYSQPQKIGDNIVGRVWSFRDITESKQAEEKIKDSETRLKVMFDDSRDGLVVADAETRKFLIYNKMMCEMLGYSEEEMSHISMKDIHPEKDLPRVIETFERQRRGEIRLAENIPVKRKDGSVFYADINSSPIILTGRFYLLGSFRDITDRRQAQEELNKAHSELEQRVVQRTAALQQVNTQLLKTIEEKDRIQKILQETEKLAGAGKLAAQIAHEINNPIAGIKNSFLLLKDAIPSDYKYFEYVGRIEKEIDRVSNIVKQMFDLYRPGTRPADNFNVYDVISDISELLLTAGKEKWVHIETFCPDDITVMLPEALFRQVMYNIVQNAIQASPSKGTVKINVSKDDSKLKVQVNDEGSGVDESIKHKIFEPFFTTGTGGPGSGLGLGLAITKDIINAMNGEIHFENRSPKGTVFTISIPLTNEPKA